MLLGMDCMTPEKFDILLSKNIITINSCGGIRIRVETKRHSRPSSLESLPLDTGRASPINEHNRSCQAYLIDQHDPEAAELAVQKPIMPETERRFADAIPGVIESAPKTVKHSSGIAMFDLHPGQLAQLNSLLTEFEDVFQDKGFAASPPEEFMRIRLKPGWETQVPKKCRIYPLNADD
ncbi:hypothetical protein B0H63DRAFT_450242 [Podospora didyma]|uniref:Uncharacterized protein n=1 Tax=Podospora didyma TaxID=330526 RepID=A0AAE0NG19_9PEZI|nr:hypothetical protein B0H63DRAFT_450242 [Podospora didyma]